MGSEMCIRDRFQSAGVSRETSRPFPTAGDLRAHLSHILERIVVRVGAELGRPEVAVDTIDESNYILSASRLRKVQ